MSVMYVILSILYILLCTVLITVVLLQKKRSTGIGAVSGMSNNTDTYWDKNKGRSMEGTLEKATKILGALFFAFTLLMSVIR